MSALPPPFPPPDAASASRAAAANDKPLAVQIVRGGATVAFTSYFLFGFGFLANLVLTRVLAPADFGVFALGAFFFALLNLRPKAGIDQAFAHHPRSDAEASGTLAVLSITTGIASFALALIAAPLLVAFQYAQPVIVVLLALAAVGVSDSVMGIAWVQLDKALLFTRVSLVAAIAFPISYLPAFYLAFNGGGYWALLAQNAAYAALLLLGLWFTARRVLPEIWRVRWTFSKTLARQFLRFGVLAGLATIFATLVYQFDNFLVGTFVGAETLGYYDRAYRIAQWSSILVGSVLTRTAFYAYSRLQNDLARLTKTATMSLWIVTMLAVPIALAIFVSADELVLFLFGAKWLPSVLFLRFLVVYSVLRPLLDDANSLFIAVGHPRRTTIVNIVQAIVIVFAATPLTFQWSAVGTAIGVGITFVAGLAVTYYFVRRTLPDLKLRQAFLVPGIVTIITVALSIPIAQSLRASNLPLVVLLGIEIASVMALYFGLTLLLRPRYTHARAQYVWRLMRNRSISALEDNPIP
ncbi:MAG: oligosaccharide flippase family protein [Chloroflexi bacterium]|nr:oligosaccharide flippase family protein [Chloroflexota bacterium]